MDGIRTSNPEKSNSLKTSPFYSDLSSSSQGLVNLRREDNKEGYRNDELSMGKLAYMNFLWAFILKLGKLLKNEYIHEILADFYSRRPIPKRFVAITIISILKKENHKIRGGLD